MTDHLLDIEIDRLTNSIENAVTGEVFETKVVRLGNVDARLIKKGDWLFDWKSELARTEREIYTLCTSENPTVWQGLLSISPQKDHIFMHLLESAKFNRSALKTYVGVPGNLVAYACQCSFEQGYEGFVAFDAKTALIPHYEKSLGATWFRGNRMFIETQAASLLIAQYFDKK